MPMPDQTDEALKAEYDAMLSQFAEQQMGGPPPAAYPT